MDLEQIKRIIVSQTEEIEELFKSERIIEREVDTDELRGFLKHPNVLAILGVRRSGKSILSHLLMKNKHFGYVNFDDERLYGIEAHDLNKIVQAFYELYGSDLSYFIFDEIHNVNGWELFITRLRTSKKIIITGSNSQMLKGELATCLTGRYIDFTLFPFSFREFLRMKEIEFSEQDLYSTKKISDVKRMLEEYLKVGGFPEVHKFGKRIIVRVYEDIINKDIIRRYNIRYKDTFKEMMKYLVSNSSKEITFRKLRNIFEIKDVHTIKNYLSYTASAYLIFFLEKFSFKLKQQFKTPKKIYVIDPGIIDTISFKPIENIGMLMESLVAVELLRRKHYWKPDTEVFYWKDYQQNEVDFLVKEGVYVKQLIQVCYDVGDYETKKREVRGLINASKELKCRNLLVITSDFEGEEKIEGKTIKYTPLWKWLIV